jgi:hypothetical protein
MWVIGEPVLSPEVGLLSSLHAQLINLADTFRTTAYPKHGLDRLSLLTAGLVDAFCWEKPHLTLRKSASGQLIRDRWRDSRSIREQRPLFSVRSSKKSGGREFLIIVHLPSI